MPNNKQPIDLIMIKGRKHLTKKEIEERRTSEVAPMTDEIEAPSFLTAAQKRRFEKIADQLLKIRIMGETDCETLARYIVAQENFEQSNKELRKLRKEKPKEEACDDRKEYFVLYKLWSETVETLSRQNDRYFKQAQMAARVLGLTISDRCRLVVPETPEKPVNKFDKFKAVSDE